MIIGFDIEANAAADESVEDGQLASDAVLNFILHGQSDDGDTNSWVKESPALFEGTGFAYLSLLTPSRW